MELGKLVMTRRIADEIADTEFVQQILGAMRMYRDKNWGDLSEDDKEMNDLNAESGIGSLMGAYETCKGRIWIMTEHDRSVTTILFPDEY